MSATTASQPDSTFVEPQPNASFSSASSTSTSTSHSIGVHTTSRIDSNSGGGCRDDRSQW